MFVIDALIGNDDRHFNNWGILEKRDGSLVFAPIYDCGASLAASSTDSDMEERLSHLTEFESVELNLRSSYSIEGKRVRYCDIFKSPPPELADAIKRTVPKIDMQKIFEIIDSVPILTKIRRDYLKQALLLRYEKILVPALQKHS